MSLDLYGPEKVVEIGEVRVGDQVLTSSGWRTVTDFDDDENGRRILLDGARIGLRRPLDRLIDVRQKSAGAP